MVGRSRPDGAATKARLLAAASEEFAARGFDGAKVDRIAARARVNKAMLYYHFANKAALYREILRSVFSAVADAVGAVRAAGGPPDAQVRAFIDAVNGAALSHPHFPSMWLREVADGGRHVDEAIAAEVSRVLHTLGAILADGRKAGQFRDAHPLLVQFGIVGPLLLALASEAVRARLGPRVSVPLPPLPREAVIHHVQETTLAGLAAGARGRPPVRVSRRSRP